LFAIVVFKTGNLGPERPKISGFDNRSLKEQRIFISHFSHFVKIVSKISTFFLDI